MISLVGWPDPNTAFDQSEHALYVCYFIIANRGWAVDLRAMTYRRSIEPA